MLMKNSGVGNQKKIDLTQKCMVLIKLIGQLIINKRLSFKWFSFSMFAYILCRYQNCSIIRRAIIRSFIQRNKQQKAKKKKKYGKKKKKKKKKKNIKKKHTKKTQQFKTIQYKNKKKNFIKSSSHLLHVMVILDNQCTRFLHVNTCSLFGLSSELILEIYTKQ